MNFGIELVDKEEIKIGDAILCEDGKIRTVCKNSITNDSFMGKSIFGDCYNLGYKKVKKVIIKNPEERDKSLPYLDDDLER